MLPYPFVLHGFTAYRRTLVGAYVTDYGLDFGRISLKTNWAT